MSSRAKAWAIEITLPAVTKMVLIILAEHHNRETGQCNPSFQTISKMAGVGQRTAIEHVYKLKDMGLLTIQGKERDNKSRTSNWYDLVIGALPYAAGAQAYAGDAPLEPVKEPSPFSSTDVPENGCPIILPEWFETLSEDPRWTGKNPEKYVAAIEKEFPNINLGLEAHGAYEWLQTKEGQKKKVLRGYWRNWLKNAARPPPSQGQVAASGRPTRAPGGRTAAELKAAQERIHRRGNESP